nr:RAMP superfamily CRISPR-associated protein [Candidatus Njordarchaeota archaeon]
MRREIIPAYYDFIKVDTTRREVIPKQQFTDRRGLSNIYLFELQFITLSDVHVSTGVRDAKEKGSEVEVIMEQYASGLDGKPSIPGSSLKGVVSKNYLSLSGSGILTSELFGSSAHPAISKVFFEDARPIDSVEVKLVEVQRAWMPRRWERGSVKVYISKAPPTGKYGLMQCLPKGIALSTTMRSVSLKEFEVGGLLMSLGLNLKDNQVTTGVIKLGYG